MSYLIVCNNKNDVLLLNALLIKYSVEKGQEFILLFHTHKIENINEKNFDKNDV